jgi:benzil reductase ((S)-benzoin forming)
MFLITGGGSGIGKALTLSLVQRGQSVLIAGRRESLLQEVTAQVPSQIQYVCADVSTTEGRDMIRKKVGSQSLNALVNNAGTLTPIKKTQDIQPNEWHQVFATNLDAPLFLPQLLYKNLTGGRVLNMGSGAAYLPVQAWAPYCASKAALAMLTQCWQLDSESVVFTSVMPGISDTDMQLMARSDNTVMALEKHEFFQRLHEHNRLISPETVAAFLTWLLLDTDDATYVSQEWDIYDTSHHVQWLKAPHQVLHWDF